MKKPELLIFAIFLLIIFAYLLSLTAFDTKKLTPEMEQEARTTVTNYLRNSNLSITELSPFNSTAQPRPDFSFLYRGSGRCIEFIIDCHENICTNMKKYPFDKHGEECPK